MRVRKSKFVLAAVIFSAVIGGTMLDAQAPATASTADAALQGSWTVIGAQHNARPLDGLTGGTMTVTQDKFEIHTASGSLLKGTLKLDKTKSPAWIDLLHDSGLHWEAVYSADGEDFRLNYIAAGGKDKRPAGFKTSAETEETLVILKRKK